MKPKDDILAFDFKTMIFVVSLSWDKLHEIVGWGHRVSEIRWRIKSTLYPPPPKQGAPTKQKMEPWGTILATK